MASMSQVSFQDQTQGSQNFGATQQEMQQSLSRTRKLHGAAQEAIAQIIPEEADTGPGLQWLSLDHWEETMTEELMGIGAALMDESGDARGATACYERAYEIASQPAPPKKDPFDPDPEPIRRTKWWPCETQCRAALCAAGCILSVQSDPTILSAGTLDEVRDQLSTLHAIAKDVVAKSENSPVNNWLLYNVSVRIYSVLHDALERGLAGPALAGLMPPLLWAAAAIEASPPLCCPAYTPWRAQLAAAVCRAFDGVGQPSLALKFCARLMEKLEAITAPDEGSDDAEMLAAAVQSLSVVQFRYLACADPATAAAAAEIGALPAKFGAIVEALAGLATPNDAAPPVEGEKEVAVPPPSLVPSSRRRTLDQTAPAEDQVGAVEALVAAGQALCDEHFPTEAGEEPAEPAEGEEPVEPPPPTYSVTDAGLEISLEAHVSFVKWCFAFNQIEAFNALAPVAQWRLSAHSETEAHHMLALEIDVMVEMTKPEFSGAEPPIKYADALYALGEAQATASVSGCSDLVYDGAILLWQKVEGAAPHENGDENAAEDGMLRPEESDDRLRGGSLARCLLVVFKCLTISQADDAILCATVALRLSIVWEARASGDPEVLQLAIEVAERGVQDLEEARSKYIQGKEVSWTLSASTADGEDELFQRLCCLHVELLNKTFYLKLLQGRDNFRLHSERSHAKTLKALEKRQGLQPLYGMRTEKQAEAETLALSRPPPRPSFDPKTEGHLTIECGQNTYQQALLLCQMARFRDTKNERIPLLTQAVELLNAAERKEQMAAEHWEDFTAEGADPGAPTKTPLAPILLSRTHDSITLYAPRFKLTKSVKFWALYGKDAGPGTGCAMTNTELEETGSIREASELGPVTIGGLKPNAAYVFATAAFNGGQKVISGIGLTCVPIVAMHPLPVKLCQAYASVLAFELGCQVPATKALQPMRRAYIIDAPQSTPAGVAEPGRAACKIPGIILDQDQALKKSPAMLRAFAQALLLSVSPPGQGNTPYLVTSLPKDKETRELAPGPQAPMLSTMDDIRTLLVGLEIACSIKDDELTMQIAVALYEVLSPMADAYQKPIHLLPAVARGYEALATIDPISLCPLDDGSQPDLCVCAAAARQALCCFAYQLLEITAEAHSAPTANLAVQEVVEMVRNGMAAWVAAKAASGAAAEAAGTEGLPAAGSNPFAMPEWDALLGYVLALPADIAGDDLAGITAVAVVEEDAEGQEKATQLAGLWTQYREVGPAAAIEGAKAMVGEDKAEFLKLAAKICEAALKQGKLDEAVEQCAAALAEATVMEREQVVTMPEIVIYEPDPEPEEGAEEGAEEAEPVEEEELDEEAKAAKAEAEALALQEKHDALHARAADKLQKGLTVMAGVRNAKRKVRAQIAKETPWRAALESSLAFGEFVKWRDEGAASGIPEPTPEGEEPAEPTEGEEGGVEAKPWLGFLKRAGRSVVLATRGSNWVQLENCCRGFQNLAVWLRTHLPVEAGVDNELDGMLKEIASNAAQMLLVLKDDVAAQLALAEQEAMLHDKSSVSSSSSGSNDFWFSGLTCPDVRWMARHVVWCLQLLLEPKLKTKNEIMKDGSMVQKEALAAEFGAVADIAARLNFATDDIFAEETLPMIIKAKTALGERSDHAKDRLQMAIRDKPMAKETLDISRDIMHKLKDRPDDHEHIATKFATTIQLLRDKRETLLCCQALNELGNFHWNSGRKLEAGVAWADGIDAAFGTYAALKDWRDVLGGQDGTEARDAALIKQFGMMECLMAIMMLGKCAKYIYDADTYLRTECCRFAARVCHIMFSADVSHPHKLREFGTYRLRQLWEGVPIFESAEIAGSNLLADALDTVCNELDQAGCLLPALPALALYQHVAVDAMEDIYYSLRCATVRVRVLAQAGFFEQATATLRDLVTGVELPGVEAKVSADLPSVELLKNELPPQAESNVAAVTSACAGVLPELPATVLTAVQRDSIECGLALAQELLRLQLAAATPQGGAAGEAREALLSAAEARFAELRDSRVGTEVEKPSTEEDAEEGAVEMATVFSPLDVRTRCEAELGIATVHELRMLHRLAFVQANTVMAYMQERDRVYVEEHFDVEEALFFAQESFVGSDTWLRCRLLSIRCHTASRRYDEAIAVCGETAREAEAVNDAARACEAQAAAAAVDALMGDPVAAQETLQMVAGRMKGLSLVDEQYASILTRLAEIHDKQGRPAQASELLWQADNVLKSVAIGDEGVTGYGVMTGAAGHSLLAPAEAETLPLRHSLYLPPALPWARVHSALGCLSAGLADTAAAESHLAFAAFIAATDVPACPPRFRASMCLALGRQSRRKMGIGAFGGSFLPEAAPPAEGDEPAVEVEKHPLHETILTQLTTSLEVSMMEAGHPHALMREALLELALLHGCNDARAGAAMLATAASLTDMNSKLQKLLSAIPAGAGVTLPEFLKADLEESRQTDDAGSPLDRPITATDFLQYYLSLINASETAGAGSGLDVDAKLAACHVEAAKACPPLAAVCLTALPNVEETPAVANDTVTLLWYAADPMPMNAAPKKKTLGEFGQEEEPVRRVSLAERLGLPGSLPALPAPADAAPATWAMWCVGPLAPAEGEEVSSAPEAALGCSTVEVETSRQIHHNLTDLLHQMREDVLAEAGVPAPEEGAEVDPLVAAKQKITSGFWVECLNEIKVLFKGDEPVAVDDGELIAEDAPEKPLPVALTMENVEAVEAMMNDGTGGKSLLPEETPGAAELCAFMRSVLL